MNGVVRIAITIALAILALVAFVYFYAVAIFETLTANSTPVFSEPFVYIATGLYGLVGAVVAVGFGQKPPDTGTGGGGASGSPGGGGAAGGGGGGAAPDRFSRNLQGVAAVISTDGHPGREWLAALFALAYVLVGVAAVVTWMLRTSVTPDIIKNLATVFLGFAVPLVRGYLTD